MASDLLSLLIWASGTLSVGVAVVLLLRVPVRRFAGARVAYLLWLIPPLGYAAWLAPARQTTVTLRALVLGASGTGETGVFDWSANLLVAGWLVGLAGVAAVLYYRQRRFTAAAGLLEPMAALGRDVFAAAPTHGPAVVGALRPVIVLPSDFGSRYSADEQALVLAHERAHVERRDPLINALALATYAVHWFNPLVHVALRALRIDQELACDATVVERYGSARRTYAEAMLKSHAAAFEVPVCCAWHTTAFHPMKERILMLKTSPSRFSRRIGLSFVACAALGVGGAVWLMRPVEVLAAAAEEDALSADEIETMRQATEDARQAVIEARRAARNVTREARVAAKAEARLALLAARDAAAAARSALRSAEPAIAAARKAEIDARPAIAAAERAIREARPAIEAARKAAAVAASREVRAALAKTDALAARAWEHADERFAGACRRALARSLRGASSEDVAGRRLVEDICRAGPSDGPHAAPQD